MPSKKPLKGFNGHWIDTSWRKRSDESFYIDQVKKRKEAQARGAVQPVSSSRDSITRQMGFAVIERNFLGGTWKVEPQFALYAHSQVSDSPYHANGPATILFMDKEDLEKLIPLMLRALMNV